MIMVETTEELISVLCKKKTIIYGAGEAGKLVCNLLMSKNIQIEAFVETLRPENGEWKGIPIYKLDDLLDFYSLPNINIILAVTNIYKDSMRKELKKRKINSFIEISEILLNILFFERTKQEQRVKAKTIKAKQGKKKQGKTIGYLTPGYFDADYAEERLIIEKIEGVFYKAIPKETRNIACIGTEYEIRFNQYRMLIEACYEPMKYRPDVEAIHTFNMVCKTDIRWWASFETMMPRIWPESLAEEKYYLQLTEYIKQSNCKRLYALSKNAYEIQKDYLKKHLSLMDEKLIMKKTKVLHPPQRVLITEEEFITKHDRQKNHFIFIGREFFLKGGREMLQALSKFENQYDFKLTLISCLSYNDHFTKVSYEEAVKWRSIIMGKPWIEYYDSLPNKDVLEKCKEASIGIFPSFADTYGYVVLEMQAAGCPVITTNIRALPEINNNQCGWLCNIPVNSIGFCRASDMMVLSRKLVSELERCLCDVFEHPKLIKNKGMQALKRIREMHDPVRYQNELKSNLM